MLHPSTKRLIDKLNEMTRKQRVTWTEGENATVVHDTEGYRVVLTAEPHAVLLTDALGREIETCLPEEFIDDVDSLGRPYAKFIAELYREAHRHARGTEKAIRTLLAGLDSEEAAPPPAAGLAVIDAPHAATDESTPLGSETEITAAVATLADQINGTPAEVLAEPEPESAPELPQPAPVLVAEAIPEPEALPEPEPEPVVEALVAAAPEPEPATPVIDEIAPADEPGSFGTFGNFAQDTAATEPAATEIPALEPERIEAAPEPEPEPVPEPVQAAEEVPPPAPQAPAAPTLAQPISLSSIPFGFGLGAAQRAGAPSHPSTSTPHPEPVRTAEAPTRLVIDGTLDLPDEMPDAFQDAASADSYPPPTPEAGPMDLPGESAPVLPEPGNPRRFNPWN